MSPIKNLSDDVRWPRLGKFHLGYRDKERGFPVKTEYFVIPKDNSAYDAIFKMFGEKPKELRILIPVEDEETWASQYYRSYDMTHGLVCKGDGEIAMRMIDIKTGALPDKNTGTVTMKEITCAGKECQEYKAKKCGEVMNLRFMLPEIPGIGIWQIDTGSINSILNINSCARLIKKTFGRITLVPLILSLEPIQVNNPESGKKQTVYVLNLRSNVTLLQLADMAREQSKTLMLTNPALDEAYKQQMEEIEELWDNMPSASQRNGAKEIKESPKIIEGESRQIETVTEAKLEPEASASEKKAPPKATKKEPAKKEKPRHDPDALKNTTELQKALFEDFGLQPKEQLAELNIGAWSELTITPAEAYRQVAATRWQPPGKSEYRNTEADKE